ncbi:TonB-dependent receptor [Myroides sp. LJL116]
MKNKQVYTILLMLLTICYSVTALAQNPKLFTLSGKVIENSTSQPLEFASIYAQNQDRENIISGGMTDEKGNFSFQVPPGTYFIRIDFLGFTPLEKRDILVDQNTNVGTLKVEDDSQLLDDVVVIAQSSSVEIKLDKKVYSVGQDMLVKGGTAADVLDNVPSVTVDSEGTVSLRGSENVKVLIDGKPNGLASNIEEAMRILSAESIEKIEVITNPSARYEAEGGAGIINIILKKGKSQGINGNISGTIGNPENYNLSGNFNLRSENFNFYTTIGYRDSKSKGYSKNDSQYFDADGNTTQFINEYKTNDNKREGYNAMFGLDYFLTPSLTWSNVVSVRRNNRTAPNNVDYSYFNAQGDFSHNRQRQEDAKSTWNSVDYTTSFEKVFKDNSDHKLNLEASISQDTNDDTTYVTDINQKVTTIGYQKNTSDNDYLSGLVKLDYTLPIGESSNFEAGYLGTFKKTTNDYDLYNQNNQQQWISDPAISNTLEYKESVNALYAQFGSKITDKLNYMLGLRWETSNIDVNQLRTDDYNNKKYNDFFPSAFLNYELNESTNLSVSYSRRIMRPRGRFLNPFSNYTSDINYFKGNPDLNPAKTNAFDLGFMKRWTTFTFTGSVYLNKTEDTFQFVRYIAGQTPDGTPITVSSPINLATEYRYGLDLTLNYNPFKWWRLNGNFNFFKNQTKGDYTFIDIDGSKQIQNFDNNAYAWFTRISSKITLPYKIDWQLNGMYMAPTTTAQGKIKSSLSANISLSKDVLKDQATITVNISDLFNSRKRKMDTFLAQSHSFSEMQWRGRQMNVSFTYRFNQKKNDRQKSSSERSSDDSDMELI